MIVGGNQGSRICIRLSLLGMCINIALLSITQGQDRVLLLSLILDRLF
jgi:hypothetical protein